jgi:2-oxoglutarate/2-oxoacid ferredoxin oxidoreductase subunit beta
MGHDPRDRACATGLARDFGTKRDTGVLYRNPNPRPTYAQGVLERQTALEAQALPRSESLKRFLPTH